MVALLVVLLSPAGVAAQDSASVAQLREDLRQRFEIVAVQDGISLIPHQPTAELSLIQIRAGVVTVNGETLTGRELRERLGDETDRILRVTYLDEAGRRALAETASVAEVPPVVAPPAPTRPVPPPMPSPPEAPRREGRRGDMVRVGGSVTVEAGEVVDGDVVAVLGSARVDGEVRGEVTVVMGSLNLGPNAIVRNDVTVVGGRVNRAPGARIGGTVNEVGLGGGPGWRSPGMPWLMRDSYAARMSSLAGTLLRVALLALLALVVVALGRTTVERIADRTAEDPMRAGLVGVAAQLLFLPVLIITVVLLAVSIIGIPLLLLVPFGILLLILVSFVGFTGAAYQIGRVLNARLGWTSQSAYATVGLGILVVVAVTVLARSAAVGLGGLVGAPLSAMGYLIEYLAWTVGFGAALLLWLQGRQERRRIAAANAAGGH